MASTIPSEGMAEYYRNRPLYFAYGSNLSHTQMRQRCIHNPKKSAVPVALARLDGWKWIICDRGYANVIPPPEIRLPGMEDYWMAKTPAGGEENDTVYGLLYDMTSADEDLLDGYEEIDHDAPVASGRISGRMRPKEQGSGAYTKWYVMATVEKWLFDAPDAANGDKKGTWPRAIPVDIGQDLENCLSLVYVDEICVAESSPRVEYIARMNRGIREATPLGLPGKWVESVMRKFIPPETQAE